MKMNPVNSLLAPKQAGGYSQALEVVGCQRLLFISGQIPASLSGDIPADFPAQARLAWGNVLAQLQEAGMSVSNLVKVTMFLASRDFALASREVRREVLGTHCPALTESSLAFLMRDGCWKSKRSLRPRWLGDCCQREWRRSSHMPAHDPS
jgi:2-iminobutanoate/2-iminopropanoate deaminase